MSQGKSTTVVVMGDCNNPNLSSAIDGDTTIRVDVDVIIPVHNAATTIYEAVQSALSQEIPSHLQEGLKNYFITVVVCCYDDGSTDESLSRLREIESSLQCMTQQSQTEEKHTDPKLSSVLLIRSSCDSIARGAGFARNQAVALRDYGMPSTAKSSEYQFLCLLDSDDTMHRTRVAEQVYYMLSLDPEERQRTLLGCTFERDPPDSTWHYAKWANELTDERLMLEKFREVTILQPTWMMPRSRWLHLGGQIEAPMPDCNETILQLIARQQKDCSPMRLIHPQFDTGETLRLAEDLRFFHAHLFAGGLLRLLRTSTPLVTYRHSGNSQSFRTSRKLLLHLRVLAFEKSILHYHHLWQRNDGKFVIWGAGRDGKDFVKALSDGSRSRVYCFVDVDEKKIDAGYYNNHDLGLRVPIVHFSLLARDSNVRNDLRLKWEEGACEDEIVGRINKKRPSHEDCIVRNKLIIPQISSRQKKRRKTQPLCSENFDPSIMPDLPVVVCVAMYRTNGVLEKNVNSVGRVEGVDLWHFS